MKKIFALILDIIFPKFCFGCKIEGTWLCCSCFQSIKLNENQCCPICRQKNDGAVCQNCHPKTFLNGLFVSSIYNQTLITKLIQFYKYQYLKDLYRPLGSILAKTTHIKNISINFKNTIDHNSNTILISIPLHKKRFLERGYNQSDLLARYVAKKINITYYDQLVIRIKNTSTQAKLLKKDRFINLKSAFKINNKFDFHGKNVIIIDDVATTLATLNSCAQLLKNAGANQIWGLVLARGDYK